MVDRQVLERRLRYLEDLEARLERFGHLTRREFLENPDRHDLAERYLHLAVECMVDVGNHILADRSVEAPETTRQVIDRLGKLALIPGRLARRLERWVGFRNVLVHVYLEIDHRVAWRAITEELGDLASFRRAVARLIEPQVHEKTGRHGKRGPRSALKSSTGRASTRRSPASRSARSRSMADRPPLSGACRRRRRAPRADLG